MAVFGLSTTTAVSLSANTEVGGLVFNAAANDFTITANSGVALTISGLGIINNSGVIQRFVAAGGNGAIRFTNGSTAGFNTSFTVEGGPATDGSFGAVEFHNGSSAGYATLTINGGEVSGAFGGSVQFFDSATAGHGIFIHNGTTIAGAGRAVTLFLDRSSAANGTLRISF